VIDSVCFDTHVPALTCSRLEEIINERLSQLNAITSAGYSIAQYLIDKQVKNAIVYTEEQYWRLAEQSFMQLHINAGINVKYVSQTPFSKHNPYKGIFGMTRTSKLDVSSITRDNTLVVMKPDFDSEIAKQCGAAGVPILQLPAMLDEMRRLAFYNRPVLNFIEQHPNVRLMCFNFPSFPWGSERSKNEQMAIDKKVTRTGYFDALKQGWSTSYAEFGYSLEEIKSLLIAPPAYRDERGVRVYKDFSSKYVNTVNGRRITLGQPESPSRTLWMVGICLVYGNAAPDHGTIASYLQALCNKHSQQIIVENYGATIWGCEVDMYKTLNSIPAKGGDIVLVSGAKPVFGNYPFADLSAILKRPHNYGEVFTDPGHFNENGNRAIADALFKFLQEHDFFQNSLPPPPKTLPYLSLRRCRCSAYPKTA
jgi:[citrate (pro-3S)-lyase] ligase